MDSISHRRSPGAIIALCVLVAVLAGAGTSLAARATADGPDYYRLTGVAKGASVNLRVEAKAGSPVVGQLPAGSVCLRNLGCRGGLSSEGFATMRKAEQQRQQANSRWCQIEHEGVTGWIEGRYLAEGSCPVAVTTPVTNPEAPAESTEESSPSFQNATDPHTLLFTQGRSQVHRKGRVEGDETVDYRVRVGAGQTLSVTLRGSHGQNYFNVLPPESESAMFVGSTSGKHFAQKIPVAGEYIIRVYLMRAAARRNASSNFGLTVTLSGAAGGP